MTREPFREGRRTPWRALVAALGLATAIGFAVAGLVVVGAFVFSTVAMSHYGSNK